ncbi:dysbindin domain containing 1 [Phyllostomus discolor]|uniref:Dysbindin domain-containing protein 1 n=1 Tax=Phyllostomus discolor TaxID=89673 RepID=A0A833YD01_9CHIR|nr:dysbindin domain containing 1 [Phyllostomus discolor]
MEPPEGASPGEIVKEVEVPRAALDTPAPGTGDSCHLPVAQEEEEEVGIPIPAPGLLQVTERRQPLSSVSSLEVHFDLLDLTELTDMSDQELAEVFADSDEENLAENLAGDSPAVLARGSWGCRGDLGTAPAPNSGAPGSAALNAAFYVLRNRMGFQPARGLRLGSQ